MPDRKSTRLNSSHTVIYTLSLHDALPIWNVMARKLTGDGRRIRTTELVDDGRTIGAESDGNYARSEEHTSELQSHRDLHSFPTRRSSDLECHGAKANRRRASHSDDGTC